MTCYACSAEGRVLTDVGSIPTASTKLKVYPTYELSGNSGQLLFFYKFEVRLNGMINPKTTNKINQLFKNFVIPFILGIILGAFLFQLDYPEFKEWNWGFIIAFFALSFTVYTYHKNNKRQNSQLYLQRFLDSLKIILELLSSDKPTRRAAWISAQKIAERLKILKREITEISDRKFLDIYLRKFAHDLNLYFTKPWRYFYNVGNVENLEEAYKICGHGKAVLSSGPIPKFPEITFIDELSIRSIFDLIKDTWEKESGYGYKNDEEFLNVIAFNYSELGAYIKHIRGKLKFGMNNNV